MSKILIEFIDRQHRFCISYMIGKIFFTSIHRGYEAKLIV